MSAPTDKAAAIRAELDAIAQKRDGRLTPDDVVKAASHPQHPLHAQFEWDDKKAGHKWRVSQARTLIQSVNYQVVTRTEKVLCPVYVRDPLAKANEQGYVSVPKLRTEGDIARLSLINECRDIAARVKRAAEIAAGLDLEGDVGALLHSALAHVLDVRDIAELREAA